MKEYIDWILSTYAHVLPRCSVAPSGEFARMIRACYDCRVGRNKVAVSIVEGMGGSWIHHVDGTFAYLPSQPFKVAAIIP